MANLTIFGIDGAWGIVAIALILGAIVSLVTGDVRNAFGGACLFGILVGFGKFVITWFS